MSDPLRPKRVLIADLVTELDRCKLWAGTIRLSFPPDTDTAAIALAEMQIGWAARLCRGILEPPLDVAGLAWDVLAAETAELGLRLAPRDAA